MITVKIDELIFEKPIRISNIVKIYCKVQEFGNTSVTLYVEVRKHNVRTGVQDLILHTKIKFVHVDEEGIPLPIPERIKSRYHNRLEKFNKGLLSDEERLLEKKV
jgi:acyl-CoA thioesterase YciA